MIKRIAWVFTMRAVPAAGVIALTLIAPILVDTGKVAGFFIGMTLLYLLGIVSRFGLDTYIIKSSASRLFNKDKFVELDEVIFFAFCFFFSSIFIFFYLVFRSTELIHKYEWVFFALPAFACQGLLASFLRATGEESLGSLTDPGLSSLLAAIVVAIPNSLEHYSLEELYLYSVWLVFVITVCYIFCTRTFSSIESFDLKKVIFESWCFWLSQLASYSSQWYPLFLLKAADQQLVVYYAVANRMANLISFIGMAIDSFAAPRFSNYWKNEDRLGLSCFRRRVTELSIGAAVVAFLVVCGVSYTYGLLQSFEYSYYAISFVLAVSYSGAISLGPNGYFLMMTDDQDYATKVTFYVLGFVAILSSVFFMTKLYLMMVPTVGVAIFIRSYLLFLRAKRSILI